MSHSARSFSAGIRASAKNVVQDASGMLGKRTISSRGIAAERRSYQMVKYSALPVMRQRAIICNPGRIILSVQTPDEIIRLVLH